MQRLDTFPARHRINPDGGQHNREATQMSSTKYISNRIAYHVFNAALFALPVIVAIASLVMFARS